MEIVNIYRWPHTDCVVGRLTFKEFECFTLELPDLDNQVNISCIPDGLHPARKRFSPGKKIWVVEYLDIPNRTYIQMHPGNFTRQILGCQAIGDGIKWLDGDSILDVTNSGPTFDLLMKALPDEEFMVHIHGLKNVG